MVAVLQIDAAKSELVPIRMGTSAELKVSFQHCLKVDTATQPAMCNGVVTWHAKHGVLHNYHAWHTKVATY